MLKGMDPAFNADILRAQSALGHGGDLIIADANFPADSVARQTVTGKRRFYGCFALRKGVTGPEA